MGRRRNTCLLWQGDPDVPDTNKSIYTFASRREHTTKNMRKTNPREISLIATCTARVATGEFVWEKNKDFYNIIIQRVTRWKNVFEGKICLISLSLSYSLLLHLCPPSSTWIITHCRFALGFPPHSKPSSSRLRLQLSTSHATAVCVLLGCSAKFPLCGCVV